MAQKTLVVLEDDIDGGKAEETVLFSLDGTSYAIDLNAGNAASLRDALAPWVGAARRTGRTSKTAAALRRGRGRSGGSDLAAVREWGKAHGHSVSARGRISAELQSAYDSAH